jgi:hypothetical protein
MPLLTWVVSPHITTLVFSASHTQLYSYFFLGLTVDSCGPALFVIYGILSYRNFYAQCLINIVRIDQLLQ